MARTSGAGILFRIGACTAVVLACASLLEAQVAVDRLGARATKQVRSLQEMRQAKVVRQRWDLSCGSAALSTLLTHYLKRDTKETEIVVWLLRRTDPVRVQSRGGFSLFDLKRFAESRGYRAEGFSGMSMKELVALNAPAILPIRIKGYDHFVVFRGTAGDRVLLADPAFGNLTMEKDRFTRIWKSGITFVVHPPAAKASLGTLRDEESDYIVPEGPTVYRAVRGALAGPIPRTP